MIIDYSKVLSQFQVFITFVYIQAMANWVCVKCYPATYTKSKDRPNPDRKIWEEQQPPTESSQQMERPRLLYNGNELDDKWSKMLDRERTVLSWRWCKFCEHHCPPRAHHCKVNMTINFTMNFHSFLTWGTSLKTGEFRSHRLKHHIYLLKIEGPAKPPVQNPRFK